MSRSCFGEKVKLDNFVGLGLNSGLTGRTLKISLRFDLALAYHGLRGGSGWGVQVLGAEGQRSGWTRKLYM